MDINPGTGSSTPAQFELVKRIVKKKQKKFLYFTADDGLRGIELWSLNLNSAKSKPERETDTIWAYIMDGLAAVGENAEPGPHQKIHLRTPEASSWYNLTDGRCHTCGADISNCGCYPRTCMVSNKDFTHCGCSDCRKYPTPLCRRTVRSPAKDWRTSVMQEPPVASGYDSYRALFPHTTRDWLLLIGASNMPTQQHAPTPWRNPTTCAYPLAYIKKCAYTLWRIFFILIEKTLSSHQLGPSFFRILGRHLQRCID